MTSPTLSAMQSHHDDRLSITRDVELEDYIARIMPAVPEAVLWEVHFEPANDEYCLLVHYPQTTTGPASTEEYNMDQDGVDLAEVETGRAFAARRIERELHRKCAADPMTLLNTLEDCGVDMEGKRTIAEALVVVIDPASTLEQVHETARSLREYLAGAIEDVAKARADDEWPAGE